MYRVMLIDDEVSIRNLLKASIEWEKLDMEVVGEASSGIEAINTIDEIAPDIAFVDISMPFMNGIEFAKVAMERYPDLAIIIMTAFDEFEYARQCVRIHVFEYMLKPVVRGDVTETLERLKVELDKRIKKDEQVYEEFSNTSIDQIKKYIHENYTESTLNLALVAKHFGFNSSYLSRKFKQETGKSFLEYLNECRMERAIKISKTGTKMFQTSAMVGIPDANYFGRCFKKYTGMSYSEYVKNNSQS